MKKYILSAILLLGLGATTVQAQTPDSPDRLQLRNQHIATAQTYTGVAEIEVGEGFEIERKVKVEIKSCNRIVFTEGFKIEPGAEMVALTAGDCQEEAPEASAATAKTAESTLVGRPAMAPNPFMGSISLVLTLDDPALVSLKIFDQQGTQVATPIRGMDLGAGSHEIPIDLPHISSGTYFYHAIVEGKVYTGKIVRLN